MNRRNFLNKTSWSGFGLLSALPFFNVACSSNSPQSANEQQATSLPNTFETKKPIIVSTWKMGIKANEPAIEILNNNGRAVDAVEAGVRVPEADPSIASVGYGGTPDRDGHVTLDACIMNEKGDAGSVTFLEHIKHPISVARKVMDETPHVMLSGEGALQFALEQGFQKENLLTENAKEKWERWKKKSRYKPTGSIHHDTIGMLALDNSGDLSGACTTSGLGFKMRGRVGDSPIIGSGLFVDNEVGAATATGLGELIMKVCGAFLIVELMRNGASPKEACKEALKRIEKKYDITDQQAAFIALTKTGEVGGFSLRPGFEYALYQDGENRLVEAEYLYEWE